MPDGRVQRIDEQNETAYIIRRGRTYAAPLDEVESRARVPSARVRFDLRRRQGSEWAANVRLRQGSRSNRSHRRFGDLSGARRPGDKIDTIPARHYGIDITTQPFRVADAWLTAMADSDFDGATSLYASGAELHTPTRAVAGRRAIRAELERSELAGARPQCDDRRGVDRFVRLDCTGDGRSHTIHLVVDRGAITEQWIDIEPDLPEDDEDEDEAGTEVVRHGAVPDQAVDLATAKLDRLADHVGRPIRYTRVKLVAAPNPAVPEPARAEAVVELDGLTVRATADASSFADAVDLVIERLDARIRSSRDRRRHDPAGLPAPPGSWRHGNLARPETAYFDRPREEREVVRHKSFAGARLTPDEAAWDMAMLDYDFFLYVDAATGEDTLLEAGDDEPVAHGLDGGDDEPPAPELAVSEAIDRLNATGDPRVFFRNRASGRGNVLYRRYDGHYGLITPPAEE